jgi:hypothetical protein
MMCLAHRYNQCFNFALATKYYTVNKTPYALAGLVNHCILRLQQARLQSLHADGSLDVLNLDGPDPNGAAVVVGSRRRIAAHAKELKEEQQNLSKVVSSRHSVHMEEDEEKRRNRVDFCSFQGPHQGEHRSSSLSLF